MLMLDLRFYNIFVCPVFKPEELRQALMPTLEALYRQDPESLPFRQPVDPLLLGIPVSTHKYTNIYSDTIQDPEEMLSSMIFSFKQMSFSCCTGLL